MVIDDELQSIMFSIIFLCICIDLRPPLSQVAAEAANSRSVLALLTGSKSSPYLSPTAHVGCAIAVEQLFLQVDSTYGISTWSMDIYARCPGRCQLESLHQNPQHR